MRSSIERLDAPLVPERDTLRVTAADGDSVNALERIARPTGQRSIALQQDDQMRDVRHAAGRGRLSRVVVRIAHQGATTLAVSTRHDQRQARASNPKRGPIGPIAVRARRRSGLAPRSGSSLVQSAGEGDGCPGSSPSSTIYCAGWHGHKWARSAIASSQWRPSKGTMFSVATSTSSRHRALTSILSGSERGT